MYNYKLHYKRAIRIKNLPKLYNMLPLSFNNDEF